MKELEIDVETFSSEDIFRVGAYKYVEAPDFEIQLLTYSKDKGKTHLVDLASGEKLPDEIIQALKDPTVIKRAHNANFERLATKAHYGIYADPLQWHDTMILCMESGVPASLGRAAEYLKLPIQKDKRGKMLIRYFSALCKPTKANGQRVRNFPTDDPEKWQAYKEYNSGDVDTELGIDGALKHTPMVDSEWKLWALDQRINDRGVLLDMGLVNGSISIMNNLLEKGKEKMKQLTGLDNPNSLKQLKEWLEEKGTPFKTLGKDAVQAALDLGNLPPEVAEVLSLKLSLSNSSTKKYEAMKRAVCDDGRVRGLLQFYGAARSGRWAGRLVQVQNLPRNYLELDELKEARELVKKQDVDGLELLYGSAPNVIKQLIRTAFIAKPDHTFAISDFSQIEARVIAWLAGERWEMEVFRRNDDIYKETASQMFNIPVAKIDKKIRQKGKISVLALGYQGGVGAMLQMGAEKMGLKEEELQPLVTAWRKSSPHIVKFWHDVQKAAVEAIKTGAPQDLQHGLRFYTKPGFLHVRLPSGRALSYSRPRLEPGEYGDRITYYGQGQKAGFMKQETYGGKLVENIVQATARDLLGYAMLNVDKAGFPIVFPVHDEIVAEVPKNSEKHSLEKMESIMTQNPSWAKDIPLNAGAYTSDFYRKD